MCLHSSHVEYGIDLRFCYFSGGGFNGNLQTEAKQSDIECKPKHIDNARNSELIE